MEPAEVLDRAADLLWLYGRCTGRVEDEQGRLCVRGAIMRALDVDNYFLPPAWGVQQQLGRYLAAHRELLPLSWDGSILHEEMADDGMYPPWIFNDRTKDDELVVDTLRRCAKSLRETS